MSSPGGSEGHAQADQKATERAAGPRAGERHHGRIKALVNGRCRGMATRYLPAYLGWHRAMLRDGFTGKALLDRALA